MIAGPSGSGKSRLARLAGCPALRLDDFYLDADHPDMPRSPIGIIDWDDPRSWDADAAVSALTTLLEAGELEAPAYSISESRRVGSHPLRMDGADCLTAEGIFAMEFLATCRRAGMTMEALYIDRPGPVVFWLRLRRDLAKKRKPPLILLRRGLALWQAQPALRRKAIAAGFTPMTMAQAATHLTRPIAHPTSPPAIRESESPS